MDEHHYIFGTEPEHLNETKEVKMRLPIAHLIRLHGLKLVTGQNISETVSSALSDYFEKAEGAKRQRQAAKEGQADDVVPPVPARESA